MPAPGAAQPDIIGSPIPDVAGEGYYLYARHRSRGVRAAVAGSVVHYYDFKPQTFRDGWGMDGLKALHQQIAGVPTHNHDADVGYGTIARVFLNRLRPCVRLSHRPSLARRPPADNSGGHYSRLQHEVCGGTGR